MKVTPVNELPFSKSFNNIYLNKPIMIIYYYRLIIINSYLFSKLGDFILLLGLSVINIKNYEFIILTYWVSINNSVISK